MSRTPPIIFSRMLNTIGTKFGLNSPVVKTALTIFQTENNISNIKYKHFQSRRERACL